MATFMAKKGTEVRIHRAFEIRVKKMSAEWSY